MEYMRLISGDPSLAVGWVPMYERVFPAATGVLTVRSFIMGCWGYSGWMGTLGTSSAQILFGFSLVVGRRSVCCLVGLLGSWCVGSLDVDW